MVLISHRQTVDLNLYRLSPQYYKRKSNVEIKAFVNYGKSKSQLFCDKSNRSYRAGLKCSFIPDEQNLHSMGEEKSLLKVRKTQWQALGFTNTLKRRYQFLSLSKQHFSIINNSKESFMQLYLETFELRDGNYTQQALFQT